MKTLKTKLTVLLAVVASGLGGAAQAHNEHQAHHTITMKACARVIDDFNTPLTTRDNTFVPQVQYKYNGSWANWGSDTSGDWKHASGSEIHIQNNDQNRNKWWCMKDARSHEVKAPHTTTSTFETHKNARVEVSRGDDAHFDIIWRFNVDNPSHNRLCIEGDYGPYDTGWQTRIWTAKDSC